MNTIVDRNEAIRGGYRSFTYAFDIPREQGMLENAIAQLGKKPFILVLASKTAQHAASGQAVELWIPKVKRSETLGRKQLVGARYWREIASR